jgi:hypothetical protein
MVYWRALHFNLMQRTLARRFWSFADLNFLIVHADQKPTEVAHVEIRRNSRNDRPRLRPRRQDRRRDNSEFPSSIPRQLPASPMLVFPVGVEHALDMTV